MSAPVTTKSADVSLYPLGDPAYITRIGFSDLDAAEDWLYLPDFSTNSANGSRILRVNIDTLAAEIWLDVGTLPPQVFGLCFSHDRSKLLCSVSGDTNLYAVDFATKALSVVGDLGVSFDALYRTPTPGVFIGFAQGRKNLSLVDVGALTVVADYSTAPGWSPALDVAPDGTIYRLVQHGGPGTYGPAIKISASKFPLSKIVAGYYLNGDQIGAAHQAAFSSGKGIAVNDDASVVYVLNVYKLRVVAAGVVTDLGGDDSVTIQAMARGKNKLITGNQTLVNVWT